MIRIIEHKNEWDQWLAKMDQFDFYHSYDYHYVLQNTDEKPLLIAYEQDGTFIGLPVIKRQLENGFYDLTSIHGYLGPVYKNLHSDFDNEKFTQDLTDFFQKEKVVTVFSKLNPYLPKQKLILQNVGQIETVGELVYFDQTISSEDQCAVYNRNTRQVIKKLRKGCEIRIGNLNNDLETFIAYYHKSLDRLKAKSIFYVDDHYFNTLSNSKLFKTEILFVIDCETEEIMAGAFLFETNEIAHIELAFTVEKFFKSSPLRLLFDECRKRYKKNGIKVLNLGGGRGGREGSLMRFKSSFSKNYAEFNVWKYVAIPETYESMLTQEQKDNESNYFPKYRLKTI